MPETALERQAAELGQLVERLLDAPPPPPLSAPPGVELPAEGSAGPLAAVLADLASLRDTLRETTQAVRQAAGVMEGLAGHLRDMMERQAAEPAYAVATPPALIGEGEPAWAPAPEAESAGPPSSLRASVLRQTRTPPVEEAEAGAPGFRLGRALAQAAALILAAAGGAALVIARPDLVDAARRWLG